MDINKIKKRLETFKEQSTLKSSFLWKPPAGKSLIRIIPYQYDKDSQYVELFFHFNISKGKPILSPMSYGEPDPIMEFAQKLKRSGTKEDFLLSKKLEPKQRFFTPVIVRGSEEDGIKVWGFGITVYKELGDVVADDDYGDISHPTKGRDITVQLVTPAEAGNQFGKTKIVVKPNVTPLTDNPETLKTLLTTQPNISELYKKNTYEELSDMLKAYLNPEEKKETSEDGEPKSKETSKSGKASASETPDVSAAFNELFDKE